MSWIDRRIAILSAGICGCLFFPPPGLGEPLKAQDQSMALMGDVIQVEGQTYVVRQVHDDKGRLKRQIVAGPRSSQILIDRNRDGQADYFEASDPEATLRAAAAYRGHFRQLYIERKIDESSAQGLLRLGFELGSDRKTYQLISRRFTPYQTMKKVVVGDSPFNGQFTGQCSGPESEIKKMHENWLAVFNVLSKGESELTRDRLACLMDRYEEFLFDKSCREGVFASSMPDLKTGFADIIMSADGALSPSVSTGSPRYLQCLDLHRLDVHATKVEAFFTEASADIAGILSKLSRTEKSNLAASGQCSRIPSDAILKKYTSTLAGLGYQGPVIRCEAKWNHTGHIASYDPRKKQLILHQSSTEAAKQLRLGKGSDAYASALFHELLHSSGMEESDHDFMDEVEGCCVQGDAVACRNLTESTKRYEVEQFYGAIFGERFAGYPSAVQFLNEQISSVKPANEVLSGYYAHLNGRKEEDDKIYRSCLDQERTSCDQDCKRTACERVYFERLYEHTKTYFDDLCKLATTSMAQNKCGAVKGRFLSLFTPNEEPQLCYIQRAATSAREPRPVASNVTPGWFLNLPRFHMPALLAYGEQSPSAIRNCSDPIADELLDPPEGLISLLAGQQFDFNTMPEAVQQEITAHPQVKLVVETEVSKVIADQVNEPSGSPADLVQGQPVTVVVPPAAGIPQSPVPAQPVRLGEPNAGRRDVAATTMRGQAVVASAKKIAHSLFPEPAHARNSGAAERAEAGEVQNKQNRFDSQETEPGAAPSPAPGEWRLKPVQLSRLTIGGNDYSVAVSAAAPGSTGSPPAKPSAGGQAPAIKSNQAPAAMTPDSGGQASQHQAVRVDPNEKGSGRRPTASLPPSLDQDGQARARGEKTIQQKGQVKNAAARRPVSQKRGPASTGLNTRELNQTVLSDSLALRRFLKGPYRQVVNHLNNIDLRRSLIRFEIRITDHQGHRYGVRNPLYHLAYCPGLAALIEDGMCPP